MSTTVKAEIPATVWQVRVEVGDQVAVDDELVVLESMKMEIPVVAPRAGVVTAVHVARTTGSPRATPLQTSAEPAGRPREHVPPPRDGPHMRMTISGR